MYLVMFHKNWKSFLRNIAVTSLAEVWIETRYIELLRGHFGVTSLAEVWIETLQSLLISVIVSSLPLRKCGLKRGSVGVAYGDHSHFPCGSVD